MGRRTVSVNDRARQLVAQEAARIIVDQGIQDFRIAKLKAADRLGLNKRGSLPGNREISKRSASITRSLVASLTSISCCHFVVPRSPRWRSSHPSTRDWSVQY